MSTFQDPPHIALLVTDLQNDVMTNAYDRDWRTAGVVTADEVEFRGTGDDA